MTASIIIFSILISFKAVTSDKYWLRNKSRSFIDNLAGTQDPRTYLNQEGKATFGQKYKIQIVDKIPKHFDARDRWRKCPSLNEVPSQGHCSSCWAVSAASIMTDRLCIATKGREKFQFSAEDIITCCKDCTEEKQGCRDGKAYEVWGFWKDVGVVSGGYYGSYTGCKPLSDTIFYYHEIIGGDKDISLPCLHECTNKNYTVSYSHDKKTSFKKFVLVNRSLEEIQSEIMTRGPVQANVEVFQDFLEYTGGVYSHGKKDVSGNWHSLIILGWGEEDGTPYWLVKNTWGVEWGYKGFGKIKRGSNEVHLEETIFGGIISPTKKLNIQYAPAVKHSSSVFLIFVNFCTILIFDLSKSV